MRRIAGKLRGWNSISDIARKLKITKASAYVYITRLAKRNLILSKIKKPRGTMYYISELPAPQKEAGLLHSTDLISEGLEFSNKKISAEHRIAYLLCRYKSTKNIRYYEEAKKFVRRIKDWKNLYRYNAAHAVKKLFGKFYNDCRKTISKVPRMPLRYRRLYAG